MRKIARCRTVSGFTLFEMIVVITIFILMAGGIYATMTAAMQASAVLAEENLRTQRLDAFVSLLRRTLHNLPATAKISGGVGDEGGDASPMIVLRDAPGVFAWGSEGVSAGTVVLSARPQLGGGRQFSLLQHPSLLSEMELREVLQGEGWLRLLPDVREAFWLFYNEAQEDWVHQLPEEGARPPLVQLGLTMLGEEIPRTYVFWLPPVEEGSVAAPRNGPSPSGGNLEVPAVP
jgi:type II secretory pathway pseudopilin PulG